VKAPHGMAVINGKDRDVQIDYLWVNGMVHHAVHSAQHGRY
jgi:hypothetical protein